MEHRKIIGESEKNKKLTKHVRAKTGKVLGESKEN